MNEEFVPFELAKRLQEKGCSVKCLAFYTNVGILHCNESLGPHETYMDLLEMNNNQRGRGLIYDAPTISQVLKWLREEKNIHIGFGYTPRKKWRHVVMYMDDRFYNKPTLTVDGFLKIEQAAIAGIEYVLDKMI